MSFIPEYWSDIRLYHVTPRPSLKYLGLGPACTVRTGTTNRIPSADATSPPPQIFARGRGLRARRTKSVAAKNRGIAVRVVADPKANAKYTASTGEKLNLDKNETQYLLDVFDFENPL